MAGAGYKDFTDGDVLSAAQVDTYLNQQTVMVFATAAARTTALSLVLAKGMVSYRSDADVIESYNGAAWVPLDDPNAIQNALLTTTGDTIYASAASTPARLGIGATGQVLTVAGGIPSWVAAPSGKVVQIVNTQTGTTATGTTVLPNDGTIPQNTEGDQYMSLAITPANINNILTIQVVANFSCGVNLGDLGVALFQDATANALAATGIRLAASTAGMSALNYRMVAGTTSATTFKVRIGNASAGTTTFNENKYGNVVASSITITESTP